MATMGIVQSCSGFIHRFFNSTGDGSNAIKAIKDLVEADLKPTRQRWAEFEDLANLILKEAGIDPVEGRTYDPGAYSALGEKRASEAAIRLDGKRRR